MNHREAAIISAYVGISFGVENFHYFHKYVEEKFGYPIYTQQLGKKEFWDELKEKSSEDFIILLASLTDE